MNELQIKSLTRCFEGKLGFYHHFSMACQNSMNFSVYEPPQAAIAPVPVVYFLSGLTCTEENFMVKAGAQRIAAELGLMLVVPDTSPRNTGIPGESDRWDFGAGAGFYVDATQDPWQAHYQMYRYVTEELPAIVAQNFPADLSRQSIFGHSMGGHGALVCGLRNTDRYRSISAFAPIAAPSRCPWGETAFTQYLGPDREAWKAYDASELVLTVQHPYPILIDQGTEDKFLGDRQLLPELFQSACQQAGQALELRYHSGYDHGYYFISTFVEDHLQFHSKALGASTVF